MINLNSPGLEQFQSNRTDLTSLEISNINQLPNETLQNIFSNLNPSEILEMRKVCSLWNNNALTAFSYKNSINNFLNFLYFLKENLSQYPNESQKINSDIKILEKRPKENIADFEFLSKYNLETRIAETLINIRLTDLKNLVKLSKNLNEPYYISILKAAIVYQEFNVLLGEYGILPLLDGMIDDIREDYIENHVYSIDKRALKTDRYDIGIDEAVAFSSLEILEAHTCATKFYNCWSDAELIFRHVKLYPGIIPKDFHRIPHARDVEFYEKCAEICLKALKDNKFKRLVFVLREKQNIIATQFIIKYLELIGENDRASQIKALVIPGTMQLKPICRKNFLDFWIEDDSTENIAQTGKRQREEEEEEEEPSAKKTKLDL